MSEQQRAIEAAQVSTFAWNLVEDQLEPISGIHPDDLPAVQAEVARCLGTRAPLRCTFRVVDPDGSIRWLWGRGAPSYDDHGRPIRMSGVVMELTDHERLALTASEALAAREREIARLSRLYTALGQVNQAIISTPERDALLAHVCRVLVERGGFCMAWIGWHDPVTQAIVPIASAGDDTNYLASIAVFADDRPEGRGPTGTAFREGRPCITNDLLRESSTIPWRDALATRPFRSSAVLPIWEAGQLRGTLTVYADEPAFFRDEEIALLSEATADLSFALDSLARDAARHAAEASVRAERDFSDAVLRSLPGILYLYDEAGRFLRWNDNFERVSGYATDEIAGMHPLQFFVPSTRALVAARIDAVFRSGTSSLEADFLAKDGTVTRHHFTGVKTTLDGRPCLIGVGIDVSARDHAESRYRTLFDYAPDGIVIADAASYYLDANPGACRMLGYARDELIGMHASDIVVQDDAPRIGPALDAILGAADYHAEWQFRRKDGSVFPADVIATMMPDGNLIAMIRDVTARRQAERALRELNETLEARVARRTGELQAALVRAEAADHVKSAFLATMSHELRTPLNSIIGFTGIVLQGMAGPLTAEQTKQLGMVRGSARHLLELINDVLDLSKIEAEQLELHTAPFDLRASIERAVATIAPLADAKRLPVIVQIAPGVGELVSDRRRVEQILLNLLSNAIKFTDRGRVTLMADVAGAVVRVRIADTGVGIAAHDLATLFQPFRQLDTGLTRRHEGTGLGLAICRRLAKLLGGEICVASEPGRGTELTVTIPYPKAPS